MGIEKNEVFDSPTQWYKAKILGIFAKSGVIGRQGESLWWVRKYPTLASLFGIVEFAAPRLLTFYTCVHLDVNAAS